MADLDKARATQLANIEKRTGKSLDELTRIVKSSGLSKHGETVAMLKRDLGMGHGDANTLVHVVRQAEEGAPGDDASSFAEVLDQLYAGKKEALRPIHEKLQKALDKMKDFEIAPKKSYVSYRRKKQFATIGPATNTRVEVGLNFTDVEPTDRLEKLPAGKMTKYLVKITDVEQVDAELIGWIEKAHRAAG